MILLAHLGLKGFHGNLELSMGGHNTLQGGGHVAMVTAGFAQTLLQATRLSGDREGKKE